MSSRRILKGALIADTTIATAYPLHRSRYTGARLRLTGSVHWKEGFDSFHKTLLDEFCRVAFRKKLYRRIEELQTDLDAWLVEYNEQRPHQGRWCYGKTPIETFIDTLPVAKEKLMQVLPEASKHKAA